MKCVSRKAWTNWKGFGLEVLKLGMFNLEKRKLRNERTVFTEDFKKEWDSLFPMSVEDRTRNNRLKMKREIS